jgi:hypothetical protein
MPSKACNGYSPAEVVSVPGLVAGVTLILGSRRSPSCDRFAPDSLSEGPPAAGIVRHRLPMTRPTVQAFKNTLAQAWVSTFSMADDDDAPLYLLMGGRAINQRYAQSPRLWVRTMEHIVLTLSASWACELRWMLIYPSIISARAHGTRSIRPA